MTPVRKFGESPGLTYVTCLECGKRIHYDLAAMRLGKPMLEQEAPFTQAPKETAKNSHPSEETKLAHSVPVEEPTGHVLP